MAECFCGKKLSREHVKAATCHNACECDFKCRGNDYACGGRDRISVFEWEQDITTDERPPVEDEVPGAEAKGCFVDDPNDRVLGEDTFQSYEMTGKVCTSCFIVFTNTSGIMV